MLKIIEIIIVSIFLSAFGATAITAQTANQPKDEDLQKRVAQMEAEMNQMRKELANPAFAFDWIYRFSPQFQLGAELRRFQTDYFSSGRQNSNHVNLDAAYNF